jgi:Holliday junction resolvase-like predicted endonuclease
MNDTNNNNKKSIGFKGEMYVIDKLKTKSFLLYNKNIKSINSEIDIVVYRYDIVKHTLDIRIVEVKTRGSYGFDLEYFGLDKKWRLIRPHMFKIKSEIESKFNLLTYSEIHFDLALVEYSKDFYSLYRYIKDINLML